MSEAASEAPARTGPGDLPEWIIARAADYMVRCYGRMAYDRAVARQQFLGKQGYSEAADHWIKVAEAISIALKQNGVSRNADDPQ